MDKQTESTYEEVEYTREMPAYMAYFQAIEEVFELSIVPSFADLGCNNGRLLQAFHAKYPRAEIIGYDYFEWSKKYADESIRDQIVIDDLSKPYSFSKRYSMVNCSEVGEHIPKEAEQDFLNNLSEATEDILLLTWSNQHEDHNGQHLNPRPKNYIISELLKRNFSLWEDRTQALSDVLANKLGGIGYGWWAKNIMVFKRNRFAKINSSYFIQGISTDNASHKKHLKRKGLSKKSLQQSFLELTDYIHTRISNGKGASLLRGGDGDYFFLRQMSIGSAKPGRRALTVPYSDIDIGFYRNMFWKNDVITLNLERHERRNWMKLIIIDLVEKIISKIIKRPPTPSSNAKYAYIVNIAMSPLTFLGILPSIAAYLYSKNRGGEYFKKALSIINNTGIASESIYALISTKWIFKNFNNEIGIIASENKIKLIKKLMERKEYQEYLNIDSFSDYIAVPEKGAADNPSKLIERVSNEIKASKAKIFLVGVGSSKIALLPSLRQHSNAVFIDVGAGIDAMAGIVCQERPYFAEWTNYRLKDYDYSGIDFMDKNNPAWNNKEYKTVSL